MVKPKHILITGASSGIGAALAVLYGAHGIRLLLHGRNGDRLQKVAEKAAERGATVETLIGDVTDSATMKNWIEACDARQPIDLVIANAGISGGTGIGNEWPQSRLRDPDEVRDAQSSRGENEPSQADDIFKTNLHGVLNTIHPVLPLMMKRRGGQIAIMSSLASFRGIPGAGAYCASKAAVRIYGEALRPDMAKHGVLVNVICPSFIKTPLTDLNAFPMPMLMSAERAAQIIHKGLAHNRARIAFPWVMYAGLRVFTALPQSMQDMILAHAPRKG